MGKSIAPNRRGFLYSAKTTVPRLPKVLHRKRCFDLLDGAKEYQIIYISGSAGEGKTTLAVSWLKHSRMRVVYLRLDEQDNHPESLLGALGEAFGVAFPRLRLDLPPIPTTVPYDPTVFARTYLQRLLSQIRGRCTLVLDDFHAIREEGVSNSIFKTLFENLRPGVQVVIVSRIMAPGFLSPWLATRRLFSLDPSVLRFSRDEVLALFQEVLGKSVTHEEAGTLLQITEGWVTGLILLKDRMPNKTSSMKDPRGIGLPRSDQPLAEYFFHEIFHRLESALQTFMIRSSLLESFSISSVAALIADDPSDVAAHVRSLVKRHLLSEIPVSKEPLFQYHALLREFLRNRLKELPRDEQQVCVDRAAEVLEREGQWDQAVGLFVFRQDFDRAAALIEKFGMGHVYQGKRQRLFEWVQALPAQYLIERPWLRFFLGAGREFQQPLNALDDYRSALEQFQRAGDVEGEAWAASSLAFLCFQLGQDFRMMKKYAAWARKAVKTHHAISPAARAFILFVDGLATCSADADLPRGLKRLLASARLSHENGFFFLYVSAMSFAGEVAGFSKASRNAPVFFGKAEQAISHEKFDPVLRTQLLMLRGTVHVMQSAYEEGVKDLIEGERVCLDYGLLPFLDPIQTHLAHARLRLGDPGAWDALESIHQRIASSSPNRGHEAYIFFIKAFHFFQAGDFPQAFAQVTEGIRLLNECGYFLPRRLANTLAGAILRERGDLRQAEQRLLSAHSEMGKGGHQLWMFAVLLELAKLYIDCGKEARAKRYLTRALRIGKEEGYRATSVLTDQTKCVLIQHALQWNLEPGYVRTLQTYWKVPTPLPLKIQTLGRFEVLLEDRPIPVQAWHGRKTRDLLLVLLSLGGKDVSKEKVGDLLWPEAEGDRAITNFHTTLHRLQSVLGCLRNKAVRFIDLKAGYLSFNPAKCWSDCCAFEEEIRLAQQAETEAQRREARSHLERAMDLYAGEYLPGFDQPWIVSRRQDLHRKWLWVKERLNAMATGGMAKALIFLHLLCDSADYFESLL